MPTIRKTPLLLATALLGLALAGSAAGTTSSAVTTRHFQAPIESLAISGGTVAYDLGPGTVNHRKQGTVPSKQNRVFVWTVGKGTTKKVSGKKTAGANSVGGEGVFQLAIAGSSVAWLVNEGGNLESSDMLFTSSVTSPKEHEVAQVTRSGEGCMGRETACAGKWLGGLVSASAVILFNRWTTDAHGTVTKGELDRLNGATPKLLSRSAGLVEAVSGDSQRVAVLRRDGTIALYSRLGSLLQTIHPAATPKEVAVNRNNVVVLEQSGALAVYDSRNGSLRKTFELKGNPAYLQALAVHRNIAVYSKAVHFRTNAISEGAIHAINLTTGKDRTIGNLTGAITLAEISGVGLTYASNGYGPYSYGNGTLVFMPFAKVAAAVS